MNSTDTPISFDLSDIQQFDTIQNRSGDLFLTTVDDDVLVDDGNPSDDANLVFKFRLRHNRCPAELADRCNAERI